ncbi:MAG: hypothetical protein WC223_01435 [Bacteroidales bacterium]|jgi:hypothetical protein
MKKKIKYKTIFVEYDPNKHNQFLTFLAQTANNKKHSIGRIYKEDTDDKESKDEKKQKN